MFAKYVLLGAACVAILVSGCGGPCYRGVSTVAQSSDYFDLMGARAPPDGWRSQFGPPRHDYTIPWEGTLKPFNRTLQGVHFYAFEEVLGTRDGVEESVSGLPGSTLLRFDLSAARTEAERRSAYESGVERYTQVSPAEADQAVERLVRSETIAQGTVTALDRSLEIAGVAALFDSLDLEPQPPSAPSEREISLTYRSSEWRWDFRVPTRTWKADGPTVIVADQFDQVLLSTMFHGGHDPTTAVAAARARFNASGLPPLDVPESQWTVGDGVCS